jgi:hypothetical protein
VYESVYECLFVPVYYIHTDEKLYLKLLENKSNLDQNAFQAIT